MLRGVYRASLQVHLRFFDDKDCQSRNMTIDAGSPACMAYFVIIASPGRKTVDAALNMFPTL